jgi:hypothetical protein
MKLRTKVAAAGLAAGLPLLGWGGEPAGALPPATGRATTTFTYRGQQVTCTIEGSSQVLLIGQEPNTESFLFGSTELVGDSAVCQEALIRVLYRGVYEVPGEEFSKIIDSRGDNFTSSAVSVEGWVLSLESDHSAEFACDDPPVIADTCSVSFGTTAK